MTKMTKTEYFKAIKDMIMTAQGVDQETINDYASFIDLQISQIEQKAVKAKERAEKKKAEADPLYGAVRDYVIEANDFVSAAQIVEALKDSFEELSRQKVSARLSKGVNSGEYVKEERTVDGKRMMMYKLSNSMPA